MYEQGFHTYTSDRTCKKFIGSQETIRQCWLGSQPITVSSIIIIWMLPSLLYRARMRTNVYKRNTAYSILCQQCPKKYVGQTTATLKKRCSEQQNWCQKKHKKKLFKISMKNVGIAFHYHETRHTIDLRIHKLLQLQKKKHRARGAPSQR